MGLAAALLAWPVWFALEGPGHLTGLVWPNVGVIGGFIPSSFVATSYPAGKTVFLALGGYGGAPLPSAAFLGWSFLAVLVAGLAAFWRDRRLWFFGFALAVCVACSLGERHGQWEPAWIFTRIPVFDNVIEQRFMAIGYLAAAVMLAVILDRVHRVAPDWRGALGALVVAGVALVPMATLFGERLPFVMQQVVLPRWYTEVAPTLPAGRVLLSYPAPFSGLQSAMAWQAVNGMHYSQAGGGGPQGVANRAGSAEPGFEVLTAARLRRGDARARRDPGAVRRRAPRPRRLAGQHRGDRHRSGGTQGRAGPRPDLRRRLHDGRPRPPAHDRGRGVGLERRPARPHPAPARQGRDPGEVYGRRRGQVR